MTNGTGMRAALPMALLMAAFIATGVRAAEPAPTDDAWMAALGDAMREAKAGNRDLAIRSLQRMKAAAGDNHNRRGIAGLYLGQMLYFSQRDREAQPALVEAVADLSLVRPACDEFIVKAQTYAFNSSLDLHALDAAIIYAGAQHDCVVRRLGAAHGDVAAELANVAFAERQAGRAATALATAERALAVLDVADPKRKDAVRAAQVDGARGVALAANGRWAEAKPLLASRLDTLRATRRARTLEYALVLVDHAAALKSLGDAAAGDAAFNEALNVLRGYGRRYEPWTQDVSARYAAPPAGGGT